MSAATESGGPPPCAQLTQMGAAYWGSRFHSIVDVGGATGNMLPHILQQHRGPRGVLFDLPHVVTNAPALLAARGVAERVSIEPGSFFYILSHISVATRQVKDSGV